MSICPEYLQPVGFLRDEPVLQCPEIVVAFSVCTRLFVEEWTASAEGGTVAGERRCSSPSPWARRSALLPSSCSNTVLPQSPSGVAGACCWWRRAGTVVGVCSAEPWEPRVHLGPSLCAQAVWWLTAAELEPWAGRGIVEMLICLHAAPLLTRRLQRTRGAPDHSLRALGSW